jgi:maleate isomerase
MAERTRIGVMLPSSNTTVEWDFQCLLPAETSLHAARMWLTGSDADGLERMNQDIETAAEHLASAAVDVIVYACTGGSLVEGPGYDKKIKARIEELSGIPAVPTSTAVLEALEQLGATKLSVATPYPETMTRMVGEYLEGNGFEVLALEGRAHASNLEIGADPDEAIVDFVCQAVAPDCDAVFLSCTNWNSMGVAQRLEEETGKPVVTSNQATIWSTLRTLGLKQPVEGYGRLLGM